MHTLAIGRGLLAVLGVLTFCFSAAAQQTDRTSAFDGAASVALYQPDVFTTVDGSVLVRDLPVRALLDGRVPGSTALGRMGTAPVANFPMALVSAEPRQKRNSASGPVKDPKDGKDYWSTESFAAEKASLVWTGGELGFFYGHSSGKFGGDEFGTYIVGGVGNEHMQINVGAEYDEFTGRLPRWRP